MLSYEVEKATGPTKKQMKYIRYLIEGYIRGKNIHASGRCFYRPEHAISYALASTRPKPKTVEEAKEWLALLIPAEAAGYAPTTEGMAVREIALRPEYRSWRKRALGPLKDRYGYPEAGWLDRLNQEIARKFAGWDPERGKQFAKDDALFQKYVLDPAIKKERNKS